MINKKQIWESAEKALRAFSAHYQDRMDVAAKEFGLDPPTWYPLTAAYTFKPDPISVERLRIRSPYSSPRYFDEPLMGLLKGNFIGQSPLGGYSLTHLGEEAVQSISNAAYEGMAAIPLLSVDDMRNLAHSLGRLSQACIIHGGPISRWSIIYIRRLDGSPPDTHAAKIDQYLSDIYAFRDDAHLAAWQQHDVGGHAWDVLTVVWREGFSTLEQVTNRLARRRWTRSETEAAVAELRGLGWLAQEGELAVTETGARVREEAEELTDQYFYSPWEQLSDSDMQTLADLLPTLNDRLTVE